MTKTVLFEILNFEHWNLFGIWCLEFGAYIDDGNKLSKIYIIF